MAVVHVERKHWALASARGTVRTRQTHDQNEWHSSQIEELKEKLRP
jgi:16S rRNA G1207 methylase RsmC